MEKLKSSPYFHPFLFAAFPVLFLFADNITRVTLHQIWQPIGIAFLITAAIFVVNLLLFRNARKAALLTSACVVFFFLYRPSFVTLQEQPLLVSLHLNRHRQLAMLFLAVLAIIAFLLLRSRKPFLKLTYVVNVMVLFLILPSVFTISRHFVTQLFTSNKGSGVALKQKPLPPNAPDIYYIVLDGYARQDVLKEVFEQDNEPFLKALEQRGFYIARESTSNYNQTILSLASSLNFNYLPDLPQFPKLLADDYATVTGLISQSAIRKELAAYGYKFMNISSGFFATEIKDADYYWESNLSIYFDEFEEAMLNTTPLPDFVIYYLNKDYFYNLHRKLILFSFDKLPETTEVPSPKFAFVHIISPHAPFVFDAEGNPVHSDRPFSYYDGTHYLVRGGSVAEYKTGYRDQVTYMNKRVLEAVDQILATAKNPPVIILQGDHSARIGLDWDKEENTRHREVHSVLSAYHFPNNDTTGLYQDITLVNNFRVVLNKYFKQNLPLLPDKNYYSGWEKRYDFKDVTEEVKTGKLQPL